MLPQHGHRGRDLAKAAAILRLSVAMEFGMCLSGLSGMSSWPVTFGSTATAFLKNYGDRINKEVCAGPRQSELAAVGLQP
jgi:hypothetical protein